jgi:protein ImuB
LVTREVCARYLQLPAPIREAKTLRTLLRLHLESHPPGAGIDEVTLTLDIAPGRVVQHSLLRRPLPTPDHVSTLVARLTALMGEGRCGQPRLVDSLRPGTFAMAPFAPVATPARGPAHDVPTPRTADEGQRHARQGEPAALLRRYRRPWPVRVTTADDGRPVRVTPAPTVAPGSAWRSSAPRGGAVREHAGPWRTSGEWRERPAAGHKGGPWDRDEWDVAVEDGGVYRISRDVASGDWVVEGYWD